MVRLVAMLIAVLFAVGSLGISPALAQTSAPAKTDAPAKAKTDRRRVREEDRRWPSVRAEG
jgi:hypothetical protein